MDCKRDGGEICAVIRICPHVRVCVVLLVAAIKCHLNQGGRHDSFAEQGDVVSS